METKNDWENGKAAGNQSYIDNRSISLFEPMNDADYLDKAPDKPLSVWRVLLGVFSATWYVFLVFVIMVVIFMIGYNKEIDRKRKEKEATAKSNLEAFLCDGCGLTAGDYRIVESDWKKITFEVGDRTYTLEDGKYSDYLAEEFRENVKLRLSKTLSEAKLFEGMEIEILNVGFRSNGTIFTRDHSREFTQDGFLPIEVTRDEMDSFLTYYTAGQDVSYKNSRRVEVTCEIMVRASGNHAFLVDYFSDIKNRASYLDTLTIRYRSQIEGDETGGIARKYVMDFTRWKLAVYDDSESSS